ncbi:MAG: hypothetical protein Q8K78_02270, partial [Planctomycetaceae bacterium]|nr:hypothetical protein [Planctomycetaceae bacterium]
MQPLDHHFAEKVVVPESDVAALAREWGLSSRSARSEAPWSGDRSFGKRATSHDNRWIAWF